MRATLGARRGHPENMSIPHATCCLVRLTPETGGRRGYHGVPVFHPYRPVTLGGWTPEGACARGTALGGHCPVQLCWVRQVSHLGVGGATSLHALPQPQCHPTPVPALPCRASAAAGVSPTVSVYVFRGPQSAVPCGRGASGVGNHAQPHHAYGVSMDTTPCAAGLPGPDAAGCTTPRNSAGQWVPGVSGNPAGRTPGSGSIVTELRRQLQVEHDGQPLAAAIAARLLDLARQGDIRAIREVLDRIDGTPGRVGEGDSAPVQFAPITIGRVARVGTG